MMEQFITAMDEWYNELVEEQRAATPEVVSQLRYVLGHIADARRIVKRLVKQAEDDRHEPGDMDQDDWAAFVEHANKRAAGQSVVGSFLSTFPVAEPVKWGQPVDDVMPSHPLSSASDTITRIEDMLFIDVLASDVREKDGQEVHGDDAR